MSKYQFTADMNEISGFGGEYEAACRKMVVAGLEWFDIHPTAKPEFQGYKNVYGVIHENNADAEALSEAVVAVCGDCSGGMHQASIGHILWIHENGWDKYVEESKRRFKEKEAS